MGITRRFVIIIAAGILVVALGALAGMGLELFLLYNLAAAGALLVDYRISQEGELLQVEREGDEILSIYEQEPIGFVVTNPGLRTVRFRLKDDLPEFHFRTERWWVDGRLGPNERQRLSYEVEPVKRGAFRFGDLHLRVEGRLGLCRKTYLIPMAREYRVYPNLKNLRKYRLSLCNNRLYKDARRNLRMLGKGTSFESLREYVSGDDYRKINWAATAREDRPILNQYEPEKNQHVHLLIDTGRPMSYTVKGWRKLDLVVNTALVLSDIVNQGGDLSGLLLFNERVQGMVLPGKGVEHRNRLMESLYHIEHSSRTSSYEEAFYTFRQKERHRSIVFLFTDFDTAEDAEFILRVMPVLTKNHVVVLLLIRNDGIEALGESKAEGTEALFRKGVALELLEERRRIIHLLNRQGVLCVECAPEELEMAAVNRYVEVKNRLMV